MATVTAIKNDLLTYEVGEDGIAIITINMINYPTNLFSQDFIIAYYDVAR